jgi:hypothetical protein
MQVRRHVPGAEGRTYSQKQKQEQNSQREKQEQNFQKQKHEQNFQKEEQEENELVLDSFDIP